MPSVISRLKENAELFPDLPAVSDAAQTVSYRELWEKAQDVAEQLIAQGFSNGANVLVQARADVSFAISAMGVQLAGCVLVPIEKNVSGERICRLAEELNSPLLIGGEAPNGISCLTPRPLLHSSRNCNENRWKMPPENDVAEILHTTGTTGKSKAVTLSHRAVFSSADNSRFIDRLGTDFVYLIASPLNHISALRKMYSCFISGAHAVLGDGFLDLKRYYESIDRYRVNALLLPPAALRFLLLASREKLHSLAAQIKLVHTNSAPLTETDKDALRQCLPHARLIFGYGATEAGSVCCAYDYAQFPGKANCVGRAMPHAKITVVDNQHRELHAGKDTPGCLAVSGDSVMNGYWKDPLLTSQVMLGNTLYTNDVGYMDDEGFIYVLGRDGDVINCGGLKIAPAEVENAAMQYPGIADCACFGIDDPIAGSAVKLHVVTVDKRPLDTKEFRSFLQKKLESHQLPRYIECIDAIPKTPNGKIDRRRLAAQS